MKDLIIKDLQLIANNLEKTPTKEEYFKITTLEISKKSFLKYFKSYTNALEEAQLNLKPIVVNCNTCNAELLRTKSTLNSHNFCNQSCSAKFTNSLRNYSKELTIKSCKHCNKTLNRKDKIYCNNTCQKEFEYYDYIINWQAGNILRICR